MTDAPQPTSGSLEARIIRKCTAHKKCHLQCPERRVEELGQIAAFDTRDEIPDKGAPTSWLAWFLTQVKR
jgi:hypothetical protein